MNNELNGIPTFALTNLDLFAIILDARAPAHSRVARVFVISKKAILDGSVVSPNTKCRL